MKFVVVEKRKNWRGKTIKEETPLGIYIFVKLLFLPLNVIIWLIELPYRILYSSPKKRRK